MAEWYSPYCQEVLSPLFLPLPVRMIGYNELQHQTLLARANMLVRFRRLLNTCAEAVAHSKVTRHKCCIRS